MKNFFINSQVIIYGFFILKSKIMDFKPSIYQRIVFNKFKNSDKNLIISAVAGSGKTTTIVSCIDFIPKGKDSIFFAFNNHIVKELQSKIKRYDVKVSTLHSFCWKSLQNHFSI